MEFIAHRINTIQQLIKVPKHCGIEIDLRDNQNGSVHLSHDPFMSGVLLDDFLKHYEHGTLILNIKSDGIEGLVLNALTKYNIKNFFFLDLSFPSLMRLSKNNQTNIAVRFSDFECIENVIKLKDRVTWIWLDSFEALELNESIIEIILNCGLKTCIVSPELQSRDFEIERYISIIRNLKFLPDAVCSKIHNYSIWSMLSSM